MTMKRISLQCKNVNRTLFQEKFLDIQCFALEPKKSKARKSESIWLTFNKHASFQEVITALNTAFEVSDGKCLRIGKMSAPDLHTFDGTPLMAKAKETST